MFSVASLAMAIAIMTFLPRPVSLSTAARSRRTADGPDANATVASTRPQLRCAARAAFANPVTRTALAIIAASHMAMVAVMSVTPAHLRYTHHTIHEGAAADQHVLTLIGLVISLHTLGLFTVGLVTVVTATILHSRGRLTQSTDAITITLSRRLYDRLTRPAFRRAR